MLEDLLEEGLIHPPPLEGRVHQDAAEGARSQSSITPLSYTPVCELRTYSPPPTVSSGNAPAGWWKFVGKTVPSLSFYVGKVGRLKTPD